MPRSTPIKLFFSVALVCALLIAAFGAIHGGGSSSTSTDNPDAVKAWLAQRLDRPPMPAPKPDEPQVLLLWRTQQDAAKVMPYVKLVDHPEGLRGVYGMDVATTDGLAEKVHLREIISTRPVAGAWLVVVNRYGHPEVATPLLSEENIAKAFRKARGEHVDLDGASDPYLDQLAPDFTTTQQNGKPFKLSALRGKKVVLTFYCGCNYCAAMADVLGRLQKDPQFKDVQWYAITHMTPPRTWTFIKEHGQTFTPLNETTSGIAQKYDSITCPRVWYIAPDGRVRYYSYLREDPPMVAPSLARALTL